MASTPERKVKEKVVTVLKQYGAYYFFPATYGLGRAGVPDIIACRHGFFIAIECKAGKGTTTALQVRELDRIRKAGGIAMVINETNIDLVHENLTHIKDRENEIDRLIGDCGEQISKVLRDYFLCDESIQYFKNEITVNQQLKIPKTFNVDEIIRESIREKILSDFLKKDILNKYLTI